MPLPPPPLSPHIQIYRPQWTAALSILHRLTGVALSIGLLPLTWFLYAAATGPSPFELFTGFFTSPIGIFMAMGWSFCLFYHACMGVRHLILDTGRLFAPQKAERAGQALLALAVVLTLSLWFYIFV